MLCARLCRLGRCLKRERKADKMSTLDVLFSGFFRGDSSAGRSEEERIADILKIAESCPTGKKVLDDARERHSRLKIRMVPGMKHMGGYNSRGRTISLNPSFCDEKLVTTLIHEASHSLQDEDIFERANLKSMIMATRACEADASAHEAAAAFEIGGKVRDCFAENHSQILKAYENEISLRGNPNSALAEAFKSWYDNKSYVALYDDRVLAYARKKDYVRPGTAFSADRILKAAVSPDKDGKRYIEDSASFLYEQRFLTLSRKTAFKGRYTGFLCSDKSLTECYSERKDGSIASPKVTGAELSAFVRNKGRQA